MANAKSLQARSGSYSHTMPGRGGSRGSQLESQTPLGGHPAPTHSPGWCAPTPRPLHGLCLPPATTAGCLHSVVRVLGSRTALYTHDLFTCSAGDEAGASRTQAEPSTPKLHPSPNYPIYFHKNPDRKGRLYPYFYRLRNSAPAQSRNGRGSWARWRNPNTWEAEAGLVRV